MLNKITVAAAIAIGISTGIAIGNSIPPGKAAGLGGYTYTQRVCQGYGQQPRWYYVLDPNIHHSTGNAFLRTTGLAGWSAGDPTPDSSYLQISATRYQYVPGAPIRGGGQYVRWAHIAWCR